MFAKLIAEWRSLYEGYKGSWSPGGDSPWDEPAGHSLPPENPDHPRQIPVDPAKKRLMRMKSSAAARKPGFDPMKAPSGVISSTQKKPATPPPIPGMRKGPPPIPKR